MKEVFLSGVRCVSPWRTHGIFVFDVQKSLAYARGTATVREWMNPQFENALNTRVLERIAIACRMWGDCLIALSGALSD
jgi:hypothetical protein